MYSLVDTILGPLLDLSWIRISAGGLILLVMVLAALCGRTVFAKGGSRYGAPTALVLTLAVLVFADGKLSASWSLFVAMAFLLGISAILCAFLPRRFCCILGMLPAGISLFQGLTLWMGQELLPDCVLMALCSACALFFTALGAFRRDAAPAVPSSAPAAQPACGQLSFLSGEYTGQTVPMKDGMTLKLGGDPGICQLILQGDRLPCRCSLCWYAQTNAYLIVNLSDEPILREREKPLLPGESVVAAPGSRLKLSKNGPIIRVG